MTRRSQYPRLSCLVAVPVGRPDVAVGTATPGELRQTLVRVREIGDIVSKQMSIDYDSSDLAAGCGVAPNG